MMGAMTVIRGLTAGALLIVMGLAQDGSAGQRADPGTVAASDATATNFLPPGTATVTSAIPWPVMGRADCATPRK